MLLTRSLPLTTTTVFGEWHPTLLHSITSLCPQTNFLNFILTIFLRELMRVVSLFYRAWDLPKVPQNLWGCSRSGVWNLPTAYLGLQRNKWNKQPSPSQMFFLTHVHTHWEILAVLFVLPWLGARKAAHLALQLGPLSAWPWVREICHEMFLLFRAQQSQGLTSIKSCESKD